MSADQIIAGILGGVLGSIAAEAIGDRLVRRWRALAMRIADRAAECDITSFGIPTADGWYDFRVEEDLQDDEWQDSLDAIEHQDGLDAIAYLAWRGKLEFHPDSKLIVRVKS